MILPDLQPLAQPINSLTELPGNPRRGDIAAVARSYETFGQRKPIVARRSDRVVLAGNHQLAAARQLGWTDIAVVWVDDDEATAAAFAIADNRTGELGDNDDALLAAMLQTIDDTTLLASTGYTDADLLELLRSGEPETLTDVDDIPEVAPDSITQAGDLWELGPHKLACGSATDKSNYDAFAQADAVWTDPPYGVEYVGKTGESLTIENDGHDTNALRTLLHDSFTKSLTACQPGAPWYVCGPPGPQIIAFAQVLTELGIWRQTLIWVKPSMVLGHSDYHYRHEMIYTGYAPGAPGRQGRGGANWYGPNNETSVLEFDKPTASRLHPTMKPVALIERCITNSTRPGDLILDPFAGSGSTLIAAHQTGRRANLIELDPHYCDVIVKRFQQHTGQPVFLNRAGNRRLFTTE